MQSSVDVAVEILKDLEEFNRSGSKEAFRKQLREEFVRRSGAAGLDEALVTAAAPARPSGETSTVSRSDWTKMHRDFVVSEAPDKVRPLSSAFTGPTASE